MFIFSEPPIDSVSRETSLSVFSGGEVGCNLEGYVAVRFFSGGSGNVLEMEIFPKFSGNGNIVGRLMNALDQRTVVKVCGNAFSREADTF